MDTHDTRCPYCGRFVQAYADGYYDTSERNSDPEFTPVAAFCDESHAALFHGRKVPANYWRPSLTT